MGYTMDGSYAEYAVAWASHVVPVPDGVAPVDAAPLTCAGVTTYKALKVAHPQPGETAMVVGIGGLGHLGLQYARVFGTRTVAVDVHDDKLAARQGARRRPRRRRARRPGGRSSRRSAASTSPW